jgi:putative ribosome biogenesis GTPase RsgA
MNNNNVIDKVVMILGDCGVGKSSIISSYQDFENRAENNRQTLNREREKTLCKFKVKKVWITLNLRRELMINYID